MKLSSLERWGVLHEQLMAIRHFLQRQGTLVKKRFGGRPYWYIRYFEEVDGLRIQRALYVGSDLWVVEKVRDFMKKMKEIRRLDRETDAVVKRLPAFLRECWPGRA